VAVRCTENQQYWSNKAFQAQVAYWGADQVWNYEYQENVTAQLKEQLEKLRADVRLRQNNMEQLLKRLNSDSIDQENFVEQFYIESKNISLFSTAGMLSLTKYIFCHSVASLNTQPPCKFCVVVIGSLAKGEATPYSDIEYLFLIEHKTLATVAYFEKLAVSSYFIIGNLKETSLGHMAIAEIQGWFDDRQKNGYRIDGLTEKGGNIPTGNGSESQNHYILTPSELLERYVHIWQNPQEEALRGDLTAKLQYTELVYSSHEGADNLLKWFRDKRKYLVPNAERQEANRRMFVSDAKKYGFKPTEELINNGFSINTKRELYRYPSILLYNLSIILGTLKSNSWETLDSLLLDDLISPSIHRAVSFLLACACYFRHSAYLWYDSADDRLSVLPETFFAASANHEITKISKSSGQRWFLPQKLFNLHCDYSIPLKKHISLCESQTIKQIIKQQIPEPNWLVKFQTYHCCNRWSESRAHFHEHISESSVLQNPETTIAIIHQMINGDFEDLWNSVKALTYSLNQLRKDKEALEYHLHIQKMIEAGFSARSFEATQLIMADSKAEAAECYYGLTDYAKAAEYYTASLHIRSIHLSRNDELLAKTCLCLGRAYNMMLSYQKAKEYLLKALQICYNQTSQEVVYNYYGEIVYSQETVQPLVGLLQMTPQNRLKHLNNPSIILAHVLWKIGLSYFYTKYYQLAFMYFNKSMQMFFELYGNEACHKDILQIMYALGAVSDMLGKHEEASIYFQRGFSIALQIYSKNSKFKIAILQFLAMKCLGIYNKILIKAFLSMPRFQVAHTQSAVAISRFGLHVVYFGQKNVAGYILEQALLMFRKVSNGDKRIEYCGYISNILSHVALNHWKHGEFEVAEKMYQESLDILSQGDSRVPGPSALEKAEIHQGIGNMYEHRRMYLKALKAYSKAKEYYQTGCDQRNHPKILETEKQICEVKKLTNQN